MNWQGKRVVVTGADGFIGSHLVEQLVAAGAEVTALALYNSFNHWGWLEDVSCLEAVKVVTGDIRDPHLCEELLEGAEVVFHLAALIPIPYSYRAPASYVETNVRSGDAEPLSGGAPPWAGAIRAHIDQRSLRHGAFCAD